MEKFNNNTYGGQTSIEEKILLSISSRSDISILALTTASEGFSAQA